MGKVTDSASPSSKTAARIGFHEEREDQSMEQKGSPANLGNGLRVLVTRRNFLKGVGLLGASAALAACSPTNGGGGASASASSASTTSAPSPMLAIIHTNDTHGHDAEVQATDDAAGNFSMAAVPALKAEWEAKGYEVILVDAGDACQGMPLVDTSDGKSAMTFMNACGYELMTVGNHEFDWGPDALAENEKLAEFPWLSANVLRKDTGELRFTANKVVELSDGTKVGFFGLTTPSTLTSTNPKNVTDFEFLRADELFSCAQGQVDELHSQGCDLVVCVGHLGNRSDAAGSSSKELLEHVEGIDLFIDGHDHEEVQEEVAGTLLVETGCYLHNIGIVVIDEGAPASELVAYGDFQEVDKALQAIIDDEEVHVESELGVVLGHTAYVLDGERGHVRVSETNLGDLVADAFRWTASQELDTKVDAGLINGGAIRVSLKAGDISLNDVKTMMPFANNLAVIDVTGAQLLETLEAACQGIGQDILMGAFPQVSGITFHLDASVPYEAGEDYPDSTFAAPAKPGARVTVENVGGRAFGEDETYSIATNDFICAGGDTYYAFKEAFDAKAPVTFGFDYEAFVSYLTVACDHEVPADYESPQGRITITGLE